LIADEIAASRSSGGDTQASVETAVSTVDDGLAKIFTLFEGYRAEAEAEVLAAHEHYQKLTEIRTKIGNINKGFLDVGNSIGETLNLMKSLAGIARDVLSQFTNLATNVASGKTKPEDAESSVHEIVNNADVKKRSLAHSSKLEQGRVAFGLGEATPERATAAANELAKLGAELNNNEYTSTALTNYAKAILNFGKQVANLDSNVKAELKKILELNLPAANSIFDSDSGKKITTPKTSVFNKTSAVGQVKGLDEIVRGESIDGTYLGQDFLDLETDKSLEAKGAAKTITDIARISGIGTAKVKKAVNAAFAKAQTNAENDAELLANFENEIAAFYNSKEANAGDRGIIDRKISEQKTRLKKESFGNVSSANEADRIRREEESLLSILNGGKGNSNPNKIPSAAQAVAAGAASIFGRWAGLFGNNEPPINTPFEPVGNPTPHQQHHPHHQLSLPPLLHPQHHPNRLKLNHHPQPKNQHPKSMVILTMLVLYGTIGKLALRQI